MASLLVTSTKLTIESLNMSYFILIEWDSSSSKSMQHSGIQYIPWKLSVSWKVIKQTINFQQQQGLKISPVSVTQPFLKQSSTLGRIKTTQLLHKVITDSYTSTTRRISITVLTGPLEGLEEFCLWDKGPLHETALLLCTQDSVRWLPKGRIWK